MAKNGPSWTCIWEKLCINVGMRLVHDGKNNPVQFEFPPDQVRFYTRMYRGSLNGGSPDISFKFVYDLRTGTEAKLIITQDSIPRKCKKVEEVWVLEGKKLTLGDWWRAVRNEEI